MESAIIGADGAQEAAVQENVLLSLPPETALSEDLSVLPAHELAVDIHEAGSFSFDTAFEQGARSTAPVSLSISAQIAAAIARPLGALNTDHAPFGPVSLQDIRTISQHPFFTGPLNRAAAHLSGLSTTTIDANHLRRFGHSGASQLALLLSTGDPSHAQQASLLVGAIVLHRHLLARALKTEREQLQMLLGTDIYRIATREAPVLHAPMADLDDGSFSIHPAFATNPVQARETGLRIIAVGQRVLHDFVHMTEPSLSALLSFRQPSQGVSEDDQIKTTVMTDRHSAHIIRLLRRRFEPWLHTIG